MPPIPSPAARASPPVPGTSTDGLAHSSKFCLSSNSSSSLIAAAAAAAAASSSSSRPRSQTPPPLSAAAAAAAAASTPSPAPPPGGWSKVPKNSTYAALMAYEEAKNASPQQQKQQLARSWSTSGAPNASAASPAATSSALNPSSGPSPSHPPSLQSPTSGASSLSGSLPLPPSFKSGGSVTTSTPPSLPPTIFAERQSASGASSAASGSGRSGAVPPGSQFRLTKVVNPALASSNASSAHRVHHKPGQPGETGGRPPALVGGGSSATSSILAAGSKKYGGGLLGGGGGIVSIGGGGVGAKTMPAPPRASGAAAAKREKKKAAAAAAGAAGHAHRSDGTAKKSKGAAAAAAAAAAGNVLGHNRPTGFAKHPRGAKVRRGGPGPPGHDSASPPVKKARGSPTGGPSTGPSGTGRGRGGGGTGGPSSSGGPTPSQKFYPRTIGVDFRKIPAPTLRGVTDHFGIHLRSETPSSNELSVAVARHFESMDAREDACIGTFLRRIDQPMGQGSVRKDVADDDGPLWATRGAALGRNFDGRSVSVAARKRKRGRNAACAGEQVAAKVTIGEGEPGGGGSAAGVGGGSGEKSAANGANGTNGTNGATGANSANSANGGGGKDSSWVWILATVQKFCVEEETYVVQDEDNGKLIRLPWTHVMRLSSGTEGFKKGDQVMAIFPETTSFYRASVSKAPVWTLTTGPHGSEPLVKEIILKFDDDDENGRTPHRRVPSRYVIPGAARYFYEEDDDIHLDSAPGIRVE